MKNALPGHMDKFHTIPDGNAVFGKQGKNWYISVGATPASSGGGQLARIRGGY